jgi:hypothetical protein
MSINGDESKHLFGLLLALVNKDTPMLQELWNNSSLCPYWTRKHLTQLLNLILQLYPHDKWSLQALQVILQKSTITEFVFRSLTLDE